MSEPGWDWVTDEMFDCALQEVADVSEKVMSVPGVYEALSEEHNNAVLEHLARENEHCDDCGAKLDDESGCGLCEGDDVPAEEGEGEEAGARK